MRTWAFGLGGAASGEGGERGEVERAGRREEWV